MWHKERWSERGKEREGTEKLEGEEETKHESVEQRRENALICYVVRFWFLSAKV